jgi:Uncharacterized protein conserved in bacteria (DUF2325)
MTELRFDPARLRQAVPSDELPFLRGRRPPAASLLFPLPQQGPSTTARRRKIWDLGGNLHCSIIGTCLSTAELRQLLTKVKLASPGASDHELHGQGVLLAGRRDGAAKLLNKALDQRHRLAIKQFDAADEEAALRALWRAAVQRGEIPGAYWAALTHPAATPAVVREVFGEVHMLSHLVGAANRADIRRLCALEAEKEALEAKIARQQAQLREAVVSRDIRIEQLGRALAAQVSPQHAASSNAGDAASERAMLTQLVADLERRLDREATQRQRAERRAAALEAELAGARKSRIAAERREHALRQELDAIEASAAPALPDAVAAADLHGLALLYVGGRPHQVGHLKAVAESAAAQFLHHDGGIEERGGLLPGLISRADAVFFPVDCVSHDAMSLVKRLCQQAGKPYRPLRSAGLGSFLAALRDPLLTGLPASSPI